MKTPGCFSSRAVVFAVSVSVGLLAHAADPTPGAKEEKPLPPIPMPIVPTRLVIPDEIPDPPQPGENKRDSGAKPALVGLATLNRIFNESEAAFDAKDYNKAADLTQELLEMFKPYSADAPERIYFNLGIAKLLGGKPVEAEAAFKDCIKHYPKGADTSRAYTGLGRSCLLQKTPEKNAEAIAAFNLAANDPKQKEEAERLIKEASAGVGPSEDKK